MISLLNIAGGFMIIYGYLNDTLDIWDYVDYFSLTLARSCTIAAKYGFFHPSHQYILYNAYMPKFLFERELVAL